MGKGGMIHPSFFYLILFPHCGYNIFEIDIGAPMNITQEQLDQMRKSRIHFCVPCYGGMVNEAFFISMLKFMAAANKLGLNFTVDTMVNESLITRGRNNLVAKFLFNQAATHLMFIDVDLGFDPEAIIRLLLANQDVVGGVYPMKRIPIRYVINTVPNPVTMGDLVEVSTLGTGFMMVKRHVIEQLISLHPELKYRDNIGIGAQYEPLMYGLFDTMIDKDDNYLSEDWTFCYLWRMAGGKIFADTGIKLDHTGYHKYAGDLDELKKVLTNQVKNGDGPGATSNVNKIELNLNDTAAVEISSKDTA